MSTNVLKFLLLLSTATATAWADSADLSVDQTHSTINVAVKATSGSFTGHLANYAIESRIDTALSTVSTLVMHFRFSDIRTGEDSRDKKMNSWQQSEKFPEASFTLSKVIAGSNGQSTAIGQLVLHGVTRDITFPLTIKADHGHYAFDGEAVVDTSAYGLPIIKMMGFLKVDPLVHIQFHLVGETKA